MKRMSLLNLAAFAMLGGLGLASAKAGDWGVSVGAYGDRGYAYVRYDDDDDDWDDDDRRVVVVNRYPTYVAPPPVVYSYPAPVYTTRAYYAPPPVVVRPYPVYSTYRVYRPAPVVYRSYHYSPVVRSYHYGRGVHVRVRR